MPLPRTPAQIEAARQNGARSRGPLDRPNDALAHAYTLLARQTGELARAAEALSPEPPARS